MKSNSNSVETCAVNGALSDFFNGIGIARNKVYRSLFKRFVQVMRNAPRARRLNSLLLVAAEVQEHGIS